MSTVVHNHKAGHRPAWSYSGSEAGIEHNILEMSESIRNAVEQLGRSQMMQCDVARAIKGMNANMSLLLKEVRGLRRDRKRRRKP